MKKFKFLCSLISALMVFSCFTANPVGAAKLDSTTFFCDFESFADGSFTSSALKAEGLMGYNTDMGETTSTAKLLTDEDGNKAVGIGGTTGHLFVSAPSVITTGKVYIGFSVKGDSFQYVRGFFEKPRSADTVSGISKYTGKNMATIEGGVATINAGSASVSNPVTCDSSKWNNIKIVVDIDNNTWTTYLEDKDLGSFVFSDGINEFYGFSLYEGYISGSGMIDNISIICDPTGKYTGVKLFSSSTETDEDGNTVITAAFSEALDAETDNIKVTKCGSDEEIAVADVTSSGTKLTITLDGSLEAGYEYIVTFDEYEDVEISAYIEPESSSKTEYYKEDFEDNDTDVEFKEYLSNGVDTADRKFETDPDVQKILESQAKDREDKDKNKYVVNGVTIEEVTGDVNGTNASGKALASSHACGFDFLTPIGSQYGIETYEFDYKWYRDNWSTDNAGKLKMSDKTILTLPVSNEWHHVKIEYDTYNDTFTVYKDGEVVGTPLTNVQFNSRLTITLTTKTSTFFIDNYEQYVTTSPLNVENVRYIDAYGKVTGANNVNPEITKIAITFSGAIDDTTIDGITLTADGGPVDFDEPVVEGKVVNLAVPGMLPGDADVELIIPSGIASLDGRLLSEDRIYNVTTKKGKFEISNLSLELNYDTVTAGGITGAEGDTVVITADVINTASMGKTLSLIYAFYNDNELVDIGFEDVIVKSDEYVTPIETKALTTKANAEYDTVKAFVWNGLDKAASQAVAVSYPVQ